VNTKLVFAEVVPTSKVRTPTTFLFLTLENFEAQFWSCLWK